MSSFINNKSRGKSLLGNLVHISRKSYCFTRNPEKSFCFKRNFVRFYNKWISPRNKWGTCHFQILMSFQYYFNIEFIIKRSSIPTNFLWVKLFIGKIEIYDLITLNYLLITLKLFQYCACNEVLIHIHNISFSETSLSIVKIEIWDLITLNYP